MRRKANQMSLSEKRSTSALCKRISGRKSSFYILIANDCDWENNNDDDNEFTSFHSLLQLN